MGVVVNVVGVLLGGGCFREPPAQNTGGTPGTCETPELIFGEGELVRDEEPLQVADDKGVDKNNPVRRMPGWLGRTTINAPGCWRDSDGIVPTVAGCHWEWKSRDEDCKTCFAPTETVIGESCLEFPILVNGQLVNVASLLVETNPGAGTCHRHAGGQGHPDVFDCQAHCKGLIDAKTGEQYDGGACEVVPNACGDGKDSARCVCALTI